ncbi:c-type cytochrome [Arundinibacter roseus]|uniref:Cytochrome c n=1 Tax=Arundinibacter roseus TaxID=2070510 RepID=A0A4R4KME9_9BACT|nr:cytochrome c [Arundinibacter roseus]TDB68206.1 cytochrome c [Arundinibacter roseus]
MNNVWKIATGLVFLLILVAGCQDSEKLKRDQYYSEGYQLYTVYCANCHQTDGKGMANLYPPILPSLKSYTKNELICTIKNGMKGELVVAGKTYNRPMPANPKLADIEIAEIVTYMYNTWGEETNYTPIDSVTAALNACSVKP